MRYLSLILGVLALTVPGANAQDNCQKFSGTIKASLVAGGWKGIAEVTIGKGQPMTGTTLTSLEAVVKGGPAVPTRPYLGREMTTITLVPGGEQIVLLTRFVVPPTLDSTGVWWVNETGSIVPADEATGKFEAIHGRVTIHGPFGPSVPQPEGIPGILGWIGEIRGNICGVVN